MTHFRVRRQATARYPQGRPRIFRSVNGKVPPPASWRDYSKTLEETSCASAVTNPTPAQRAALATYQVRLTDYQARYAAAIDLRANSAVNVKTTYTRVAPSPSFVPGWHYHNGPVIVTVTVGTFTFFDSKCGTFDLSAGHTYIESPGQVLNAKALPEKNAGIATVEFFTTRLYPDGALDPVPVVSAPCTP
jgi:hypothetical protein